MVIEYEDETEIGLGFATRKAIEFNNIELIKGKLPTNENEIMIDDLALDKLGYEQKLNQKIKLSYEDYSKKEITEKELED